MDETGHPWTPDGVAFCWQPKAALHRIREALDADHAVSSGLLVYVALSEIASDKRSHIFQTTHGYIAMRSGLSQRTVQQRIKDLAEIGILKFTVPNLRAPATYTLLPVESKPDKQPFPRVTQPLPNVAKPVLNDKQLLHSVTQRSKKAPLPTSEELNKNDKAYSTKADKLPPAQKRLADLIESLLGEQWVNDAGKWIDRIKTEFSKSERVIGDLKSAILEKRIKTTPAQYAEDTWKRFT